MSTVASLQIKLGADVSSAINGMSKAEFAALKVADSFSKAAETSQAYGTLATVAGNRVAQAAQGAQSILNNIKFDRLTQEGEKSFNSLQKVVDMTTNAGNAATLIGAGFVQAQQVANVALTGIGAAIPALGVKIAALAGPIGLAIGAVGALVGGFIAYKTAQDNTVNSQRELTNQINEQVNGMAAELAVLRNTNLNYETRGNLIDKINEKYGTTLKNMRDEAAFAGQLDKAYKDLATSIKNKILIEASQTAVSKLAGEIVSLQLAIKSLESNKGKRIDSLIDLGASAGQIDTESKRIDQNLTVLRDTLATKETELKEKTDGIAQLFNGVIFDEDKGKSGSKGGKGKIDEVNEAYKNLENTLTGIQTRLSQGLIQPLDVNDLQVNAFKSAIDKLITIDPDGSDAQKAIDQYKLLLEKIARTPFEVQALVKPKIDEVQPLSESTLKKTETQFNNQLGKIRYNLLGGDFNPLKEFVDKYIDQIEGAINITSQLGSQVLNIANLAGNFDARLDELENYYSRESELIDGSIASDSVKAARKKALEDDLNRKRKAILREQAQAQKASALFNAIINTAQGITAALATTNIPLAALVGALGAVEIGLIAGQPIPALQSGALVTGPNTVLVGEYAGASSNPELISPVDKVKKYIVEAVQSAGTGSSDLVGILRNDDLYFMMQRAEQRRLRTG